MTLQDLYGSVSQLGFEDTLGDDGSSRFIYATNRALLEIDSIRPRRKRIDINHRVPKNLLFSEPVTIEKNQSLVFTARGAKSYYFEVCGTGEYAVYITKVYAANDGNTIEELVGDQPIEPTFNSKIFAPKKGFITLNGAFIDKLTNSENEYYTDVVIEFKGDYDYTIRNLAFYDRVFSESESDIPPFANTVGYDMSELGVTDFEKFDSPPVDSNGMHLYEGYSIDKDTVFLPIDKQGIYTINYLHKVQLIDENDDINSAVPIDLEDDLAAILPNLVAAYVWLDDEPDKAQYYYNLYLARAEQIKRQSVNLNPIEFKSVYGW